MEGAVDTQTVRAMLLDQHDWIRSELAECHALATRLQQGEPVEIELDLAVARLRSGFTEHNRIESELIIPLLLPRLQRHQTRGTLLAERMIEEHLAEHEAFLELLHGSRREIAANLEELMAELDAHMAAEERTFLSPAILCGDAITATPAEDPQQAHAASPRRVAGKRGAA